MSELTEYQSPGALRTADMQNYHPLDVLWHINPEVASIAYANKEKWLSPEIAPYLALFRKCQADEKIAVVRSIVDKLAIESDERKNELIVHTRERMGRFETEGAITQESIKARAVIDVQQIASQAGIETELIKSESALQVQKLKYEAGRIFLEKNAETQKYLSDNEVRAIRIETDALRDVVLSAEQIRADAQNRATEASLIEKIKTAEYSYLARLKEAEAARTAVVSVECARADARKYGFDRAFDATRITVEAQRDMVISAEKIRAEAYVKEAEFGLAERVLSAKLDYRARRRDAEVARQNSECESTAAITQAYLFAQAVITRAALMGEIAKVRAGGLVERASYRALAMVAKEGARLLKGKNAKKVRFAGKTSYGSIEFLLSVEDGQ